jgi:hypothetical protein
MSAASMVGRHRLAGQMAGSSRHGALILGGAGAVIYPG